MAGLEFNAFIAEVALVDMADSNLARAYLKLKSRHRNAEEDLRSARDALDLEHMRVAGGHLKAAAG